MDDDEDCGIDLAVEEDDGTPPPPPTRWQTASELTGGLVALLLVSVGVFALYVAGGVFLGLLTWAAPAIAVMAAALLFARYLSRR